MPAAENILLAVHSVSVFYGDVQVIFDLSMEVRAGEIVTLIGSNGSGKTTMVNTISGVLKPRTGDIYYRGASTLKTPAYKLVEQGLIQVPEGRLLFPDLTVKENLKMGAYAKSNRKTLQKRIDWVFELFPILQERQSQNVATMSGGEQQMVAIGRGLMSSPSLLILDEPSMGLAPLLVDEMFNVIREISHNKVAILLIEQNAIQALEFSNRGYVLEQGHVVQAGLAEGLLQNDDIKSAYLGI